MNADIAVIEVALREHLQASITEVAVEAYPANPDLYRLTHPVGALLVAYAGSEYTEPVNGIQEQSMRWVVTLLMQGLYSHAGNYSPLQAARDQLAGFKPVGCRSGLYLVSDHLVGQADGVWQWDLVFKASAWYRHALCC